MIAKETFLLRPPRPDQDALDAASEIRRTACLLLLTDPSSGAFSPYRKVDLYKPPKAVKRKANFKCA